MADGDVVAEEGGKAAASVKSGIILDIGAAADDDAAIVTAHNSPTPNAGVGADFHLADDHGSGRNEAAGRDVGRVTVVGDDHARPPEA